MPFFFFFNNHLKPLTLFLRLKVVTPRHSKAAYMLILKHVFIPFFLLISILLKTHLGCCCAVACANTVDIKLSLSSFGGSSILNHHLV